MQSNKEVIKEVIKGTMALIFRSRAVCGGEGNLALSLL